MRLFGQHSFELYGEWKYSDKLKLKMNNSSSKYFTIESFPRALAAKGRVATTKGKKPGHQMQKVQINANTLNYRNTKPQTSTEKNDDESFTEC